MITAVLEGQLEKVRFETCDVFGLAIPTECPGVPQDVLNPRNTWTDKTAYDNKAKYLAGLFVKNFEKYKDGVSLDILGAAPQL